MKEEDFNKWLDSRADAFNQELHRRNPKMFASSARDPEATLVCALWDGGELGMSDNLTSHCMYCRKPIQFRPQHREALRKSCAICLVQHVQRMKEEDCDE